MIRDLHADPPRVATPIANRSLAFSRRDVLHAAMTPDEAALRRAGAFTIAVTAPRSITCKRGVAANLAAHLATLVSGARSSVCVLDADLDSRDVGARFGVAEPNLLDVASELGARMSAGGRREPADVIARVDPPGLSVIPVRRPEDVLLPLLHKKVPILAGALRGAYDFLVVDAPVAVGVGNAEWERALLHHVDALLIAVSADPATAGGVLRYLNALAVARSSGALPRHFRAHVVLTGSDDDGTRSLLGDLQLDRKLGGIPVVASIPQLWGRRVPEFALGTDLVPELQREFSSIVDKLTSESG